MANDVTLRMLLIGEDRSASKSVKGVGDAAEGVATKSKRAGDVMKGALAAGVVERAADAVLDFSKQSIDAFAELEDSTGAAGVIFGDSMGKIIEQSKTAASTLGISGQQVISAANTFGTFGKAAGLTGDDLAGFSTQMTSLAGDMASFKGTSPEQAIEAIGAAFRGVAEPIRAYGVLMNDASLKAKAMEMGLVEASTSADKIKAAQNRAILAQRTYNAAVKEHGKNSNEALRAEAGLATANSSLQKATEGTIPTLNSQQKTLAAQALILEQTKDAQGDFARTADSTSNTMKTQEAKVADLQATLGEKLAPAYTAMTEAGIKVLDYIQANVDWLGPLAAGFAAVVGVVWLFNAAVAANPISLIVIAIAALVAGLVWAYNNVDWFRAGVDSAFKAIGAVGAWLWNNALAPVIRAILKGFAWVVNGLASMLEALGQVPGFEWAKDAAKGMRDMAKSADEAASKIEDIPDAEPEIDVDDKASPAVVQIQRKINGLQGKVVKAEAKGDTAEVEKLKAKIDDLKDKKVKAEVEAKGGGEVTNLKENISGLKGKSVDAEANVKKTGVTTIRLVQGSSDRLTVQAKRLGGRARGGLTLVGEDGPELVDLPEGAWVHTASRTRALARSVESAAAVSAGSAGLTQITQNYVDVRGVLSEGDAGRQIESALNKVAKDRGGKGFKAA